MRQTMIESPILALPLEIRHNIYTQLFSNAQIVDMIRDDMNQPLRSGIFRTCRQIREEAMECYYSEKTFSLSLLNPVYDKRFALMSKYRGGLLKHLGRTQKLQLTLAVVSHIHHEAREDTETFCLRYRQSIQYQWDWYIKMLLEAKAEKGTLLRSLTIIDRVRARPLPDLDSSPEVSEVEEWREKRDAIAPLFGSLEGRVGRMMIESRALPQGNCPRPGSTFCYLCIRQ